MVTITSGAGIALWGPQSPLFLRYNYWIRVHREKKSATEPITEFREALVMLYSQMNDGTLRFIDTKGAWPDGTCGPVLNIEIYGSGYTRDQFTKAYKFLLAKEVLGELLRANVLEGTKEWGRTDNTKLHLNEHSTDRILEEMERYAEENRKAAAEHVPEPNND